MEKYQPWLIEPKWRRIWEKSKAHEVSPDSSKPKYYCLDMFPYPSGEGLHVGHWRGYVLSDVWARVKKMQGYNVLHPMGWDAFGLPAENAAIKTGLHPALHTQKAIANMKRQLQEIGAMFDWSREINTSSPEYYRWTQWMFLKLFENGLAYRRKAPANFCPSCKTVLANEQVINGLCERCDTKVTKKEFDQWFFKITAFAEDLLKDLEELAWPEKVKIMQKNWIGKSEGALIKFPISKTQFSIEVFTTRLDTIFGCTYLVLAPEHPLLESLKPLIKNWSRLKAYINQAKQKTEIERENLEREKTGLCLEGLKAINPFNQQEVPIWVADYVIGSYGTGAIMAVPAHDERDFEFAQKFKLPIVEVITKNGRPSSKLKKAYVDYGLLINSGEFSGLTSQEAQKKMIQWLSQRKLGGKKVVYRLRDWLISRQRYWGAPIPIIYCSQCGIVPVPEKDLPVLLPDLKDFKPTGTGQSPLAKSPEFVKTQCPKCQGPAQRETDTMDTFVCSSWYYLRYASPHYLKGPFDKKAVDFWLPVDQYVGGVEHAILHLLYARFLTKFLHQIGWVKFKEPFLSLFNQGMVVYQGAKMSKSKGNVVSPDEMVEQYGADTVRAYELFMGPPDQDVEWSDKGIRGCFRFLNRLWHLVLKEHQPKSDYQDQKALAVLHKTIKKINEDLEAFHLNTVVSSLMELVNFLGQYEEEISQKTWSTIIDKLILLLGPICPHLAEELWSKLGHQGSVFDQSWPSWDKRLIKEEKFVLVIQVNGKVRDKVEVSASLSEKEAKAMALASEKVQPFISQKKVKKIVYVPGRLVNLVT